MKTQSRIRLVVGVVFPLVLFISLVSLSLAREGWTTVAMFPEGENTFDFTNNETEDAYDLHIKWSHAVTVNESEPFKKVDGSTTSSTDLSNGVVKKGGGKASIKVSWDGSDPKVKEWWWTKQNGDRLGEIKKGNPTTASVPLTPSSIIREGLRVVTFDNAQGRVIVNLPDDMRAGDTISGTVMAEPNGQTPEERATNMTVLTGCVVEIEPPKKPDGTSNPKVTAQVTAAPSAITFTLPPRSTPTPPLTNVSTGSSGGLGITLTNTSGSFSIPRTTTTVPIEMVSLSLQSAAPLQPHFQLPTMGQQGRPIVITGPFDGNSSNTTLRTTVQDFEKKTENVSGGFGLLAESPRKAVFQSPTDVTGSIPITLNEGTAQTKGTFRNVGVNLTAPKTSLRKGESTELRVEVNGLQGITQPVLLHLVKGGVVTMQGGDVQSMTIKPSEVQSNGTFTTTRTITGVQTGVWNATATVVVFDVCLQDDKTGDQLQFNSTTGDYHFCNLFPTTVAGDAGRINISWYGTNTPETGSVGWGGCTITLQHNSTDGWVKAQMDRCSQTGSATVQPASTKTKFTITDRDTRDNTCACK